MVKVFERLSMILQKRVVNKPTINRSVGRGLDIQKSTGQVSIYKTTWMVIGLPKIGK